MEILIRKEPNGSIYLDKQNAYYFEALEMHKPPYNFIKITIEDGFADCEPSDFNEDLTFSTVKYYERKQNALNLVRIGQIQTRLNELSQDFIQADLGADFGKTTLEDGIIVNVIDLRKEEFKTLHNELRVLLNKEPRIYI